MLNIFTLTWNSCDKLTKLKDSLIPALEGVDYNWFIKDNASKDDTVATASSWGDKIKVIPYKNNSQNFSAGMNYLFDYASPNDKDYVMLLNNDIIFNDKRSIRNMLDLIKNDSSIGVVGAKLKFTDTQVIQHAGVVFDTPYQMPRHFRAGHTSDINSDKNRIFQVVTGAVLITTAECYKNICTSNPSGIKGMDENFHWAFDDVDLCLTVTHDIKKKVVYCGETDIFHEESASLKKNPANRLFLVHNVAHLRGKWLKRYALDQDIYNSDPKFNLYTRK